MRKLTSFCNTLRSNKPRLHSWKVSWRNRKETRRKLLWDSRLKSSQSRFKGRARMIQLRSWSWRKKSVSSWRKNWKRLMTRLRSSRKNWRCSKQSLSRWLINSKRLNLNSTKKVKSSKSCKTLGLKNQRPMKPRSKSCKPKLSSCNRRPVRSRMMPR